MLPARLDESPVLRVTVESTTVSHAFSTELAMGSDMLVVESATVPRLKYGGGEVEGSFAESCAWSEKNCREKELFL